MNRPIWLSAALFTVICKFRRQFARWSAGGMLSLGCWLAAGSLEGQEPDNVGPIRVVPYPVFRQWLDQEDPLPWSRTVYRLREDGVPDAADFTEQRQRVPANLAQMDEYRQQTLVILWDKIPGARWALNIEQAVNSFVANKNIPLPGHWTYRWERQDDRNCTLIYECNDPAATLRVDFHAKRDYVDYSLSLRIEDDVPREGLYTSVCFNHCWADGFGRDAWVLTNTGLLQLSAIPNPERIWIRRAGFAENSGYVRQMGEGFATSGVGGNLLSAKIVGPKAVPIKMPVTDARGRFIVTQRSGNNAMTVAHNSPDAISAGWSFWPCTDLDLVFRAVPPRTWTTIAARIYFLAGPIEKNLPLIQLRQSRSPEVK